MAEIAQGAGEGPRLAVLGDPVGHSLSPLMHNAALAVLAGEWPELAAWRYLAVGVRADQLPEALELLHSKGFRGLNLTIPHKVAALDLVEAVEASAARMGAVNTLIATASGWRATNTDGYGIVRAIECSFPQRPVSLAGRTVWLLGAGGAARAILLALLEAGCARIHIANRKLDRLHALRVALAERLSADELGRLRFQVSGSKPLGVEPEALVINATSLGLQPTDPSPLAAIDLPPAGWVYDTTYGCANALRAACREAGVPYADGLSMLVWQGVRSLEIWTGKAVAAEVMLAAARQGLAERSSA